MITAQSHPQWAWSKLLILLFVTCLALTSVGTIAAATTPPKPSPRARISAVSNTLNAAAAANSAADRALVSDAKALKACQIEHPKQCRAQRRAVQHAGQRLAASERRLAKLAHGSAGRATSASAMTKAPQLTVSGQTLTWTRPGNTSTFVFVRKVSGQANQYSVINGTSSTPPPVPGYTVRYSVRTHVGGSAWAPEQSIAYPAPTSSEAAPVSAPPITTPPITTPPIPTPADPQTAPIITVSGQTLTWTKIGSVSTYMFVSKAPGQEDQYSVISGNSITPPAVPGATVHYSVRTAVEGSAWAPEASIAYPMVTPPVTTPPVTTPPVTTPPATNTHEAPVITISGQTVSWNAIGGVGSYVFVRKVPGQEDQYSTVSGTSTTPVTVPGATVHFSVRTNVEGSSWAPEVSIAYPQSPTSEPPPTGSEPPPAEPEPTPPAVTGKIIGTNDGAGWGTTAARTILGGHITWNRVEIGMESNTIAESRSDGFHSLAIVGNVNDGTPLSQVNPASWAATVVSQLQSNPGITIAEAGNEMYLKGNIANPVQYGQMYLAAVNAMKAAGIHTPLLFNMLGDYPLGNWSSPSSFSWDAQGGGWLHDAVAGVPGLAAAILANGLSTHPYGALDENSYDTNGVKAVAAQEAVAKTVLGSTPAIYITEFGYSLSNCGQSDGACSEQEQSTKMRSAYQVLLADPHVAGIWWYQSHDDGTGHFGYMNNDNSTRPAFATLASIAVEQGQ